MYWGWLKYYDKDMHATSTSVDKCSQCSVEVLEPGKFISSKNISSGYFARLKLLNNFSEVFPRYMELILELYVMIAGMFS